MKTNGVRPLDSLGIACEVRECEVDPDDPAAESVARKVGMPAEEVFETLRTGRPHGVCFAVVPGDQQLDLKALAQEPSSALPARPHLPRAVALRSCPADALPTSNRRSMHSFSGHSPSSPPLAMPSRHGSGKKGEPAMRSE
jgi:hypothetical protein